MIQIAKITAIVSMIFFATANAAKADDVGNAYSLGEAAKQSGIAVGYSVSGWGHTLDINISSMLPGDARSVAQAMCANPGSRHWDTTWTVRVFLVVGSRAAAECTIQ